MPETTPQGALTGLRVLDIGTFIAAPFAATLMAEHGAEVFKIELPGTGDHARRLGTPTATGETLLWLSEARNKKSVCLDLRTPEGVEILKSLVKVSDVVCENFQAGTLEKWGIGWEELSAVNPKLILLRISGYGQTGPYANRPCFGRIANAFGGISFLSGEPDRPSRPARLRHPLRLHGRPLRRLRRPDGAARPRPHRPRPGHRRRPLRRHLPHPRRSRPRLPADRLHPQARRRRNPHRRPTQPLPHQGRALDRHRLHQRPHLRPPHHPHGPARPLRRPALRHQRRPPPPPPRRQRHHRRLDSSSMDRDEVLDRCSKAEVPCGPVYAIDEIFQDPHYAHRGNILRFHRRAQVGELAIPNVVPMLMGTPGRVDWLGPKLGSHTDEVMRDVLGIPPERIADLHARQRHLTVQATPTKPLAGFKVLDLSNFLAAPLCGMFLADFGAEVLKVERPGHGDESALLGREQGRRRPLLQGRRPRQEIHRTRPPHPLRRRGRSSAWSSRRRRRPRELPHRHPREMGSRLRRPLRHQSRPRHGPCHRLRPDRPQPQPPRLRHPRRSLRRLRQRQRRGGPSPRSSPASASPTPRPASWPPS